MSLQGPETKQSNATLWSLMVLIVGSILALQPVNAASAENSRTFTSEMSVDEFRRLGLGKLSKQELAALNAWILDNPQFFLPTEEELSSSERAAPETGVAPPKVVVVTKEVDRRKPAVIKSRVVGRFDGWSGDTIFELENGQIWQQRLSGRYGNRLENPSVTIKRNRFGFYTMEVDETGRRVGVKQIR